MLGFLVLRLLAFGFTALELTSLLAASRLEGTLNPKPWADSCITQPAQKDRSSTQPGNSFFSQ